MKTITDIFKQMTDPKAFMHEFRETLRIIDPEFFEEEVKFLAASANLEKELGSTTTPTVSEYLAAKESGFVAEAIYIGWLGFQLNIDIFNNPINALMLKGDYEDLHRERRLGTLPEVQAANETIEAFYAYMRENLKDKMDLTEDISSFYTYLQTTGYKLIHYFGFRLADHFLHYVIPGYTSDSVNTMRYSRELEEYLNVNMNGLE